MKLTKSKLKQLIKEEIGRETLESEMRLEPEESDLVMRAVDGDEQAQNELENSTALEKLMMYYEDDPDQSWRDEDSVTWIMNKLTPKIVPTSDPVSRGYDTWVSDLDSRRK